MRILLASDWFRPNIIGGAEISVENLARGLMRSGHTVAVASLRESDQLVRENVDGVEHFGLPMGGVGKSPLDASRTSADSIVWQLSSEHTSRVPREVGRVLTEFRPDALVTNNLAGLSTRIWKIAAARRVPVVHTLRDYYLLCPFGTMYRAGDNCAGQCGRCSVVTLRRRLHSASVPAVVGVSQFILDQHLKHGYFPAARVNGVIRVPYEAPAGTNGALTTNGKRTIGFIGRLHPSKGVEALIHAFSRLSSKDVSLLIAGAPHRSEYGASLAALARKDSRIRLAGVMKPEAFYSSVDVVAVPSLWNEPLSRVPIEAMVHGKPFVTSTRGGVAELSRESGNGRAVDPTDPDALADALAAACEEASAGEAVNSARTARLRYAPEAIAEQYVRVIEQLGVRGSP